MICLSKHYTKPLDYNADVQKEARTKLDSLDAFICTVREKIIEASSSTRSRLAYGVNELKLKTLCGCFI